MIFDPVTYVVFDGMSEGDLSTILLLAKPPEDKTAERIQSSIEKVIKNGNIEFRTLHVDRQGTVLSR